jgi:hypothetical protein
MGSLERLAVPTAARRGIFISASGRRRYEHRYASTEQNANRENRSSHEYSGNRRFHRTAPIDRLPLRPGETWRWGGPLATPTTRGVNRQAARTSVAAWVVRTETDRCARWSHDTHPSRRPPVITIGISGRRLSIEATSHPVMRLALSCCTIGNKEVFSMKTPVTVTAIVGRINRRLTDGERLRVRPGTSSRIA